jgi:RNA polymerase sigma-70 factor (ECF subfamily)
MPLTNKNDEQLISEYLTSEKEEVFRLLLLKYTNQVYSFVRSMIGNTDAEDITQEVFIKVWRNLKKYKMGQNFKTWLFSIAKNSTIDFLRKKKALNFSDLENPGDDYSFSETIESEDLLPDEAFQKLQNSEFLKKLLEQISTEYKTILLLHYQEEMTFDEIGKILKKPLNTVKSSHRRAILELRKKI